MRKSNEIQFNEPQRQSIYALLFIAGNSFRQIISTFWPLILVYFLGRSSSWSDYYFIVIGLISVAMSLVMGILKYWKYTFHIDEDEVIIEKGVIKRSRISIPFDRIQVVRVNQNLVHRWTGTYGLTIDTAGSQSKELKLLALNGDEANSLKLQLMRLKKSHAAEETNTDSSYHSEEKEVLQHTLYDTFRVGLTQNHLRSAWYIAAFLLFIFSQIYEFVGNRIVNTAMENYDQVAVTNTIMIVGSIFTIAIVSLIISLVLALLRYYGLKVVYDGDFLRETSGLFNRREQAVRRKRIQLYSEVTNPLRKLIGIISIRIQQPVSSEEVLNQSITIPGVRYADIDVFRQFALQEMDFREPIKIKSNIVIANRLTLFIGAIPAVILGAVGYYFIGWYCLYILIWIPLTYLFVRIWHSKLSLELDAHHIVRKGGIINTVQVITDYSKIQNVSITQVPYQWRNGLCSISIYTAGGAISYPYIDEDVGRKLRDYLMYRLESEDKEWM